MFSHEEFITDNRLKYKEASFNFYQREADMAKDLLLLFVMEFMVISSDIYYEKCLGDSTFNQCLQLS